MSVTELDLAAGGFVILPLKWATRENCYGVVFTRTALDGFGNEYKIKHSDPPHLYVSDKDWGHVSGTIDQLKQEALNHHIEMVLSCLGVSK